MRSLAELRLVVAHLDWSLHERRRAGWILEPGIDAGVSLAPIPAPHLEHLRRRIAALAPCERLILGCDFPLGVPLAYARQAGIAEFVPWFLGLTAEQVRTLRAVASRAEEISPARPFYPARPGGARLDELTRRLGLADRAELYRCCDRATPRRPAAAPLFWTIGAKQVGKAALAGWFDLLRPLCGAFAGQIVFWPFAGRLTDLLPRSPVIVTETYPAECLRLLGLDSRMGSKGDAAVRRSHAARLGAIAERLSVRLAPPEREAIANGFASRPNGEDAFDALLGVLAMRDLLNTPATIPEPTSEAIRRIEGWIFGQAIDAT